MQNIISSNTRRTLILTTLMGFLLATFISMIPAELYAKCGIPDPKEPTICYDDFFGSNDIIFYDPNATDCSVLTADGGQSLTLTGNENAEKIFRFLVGQGLTAEQAAGILGNLQEESGFDPAIIQGVNGINGGKPRIATADYKTEPNIGFGLAQWTFRSRQLALEEFARTTNRTIIDLKMQVDFLWQEFSSSPALASLKNQTTPEAAARDFHITYEKSADDPARIQERAAAARELYERFKSLAPASSIGTQSPGDCPASPGSGTGLSDFMGDNFHIYNQCQYPPYGGPWGTLRTPYGQTMCEAACGPTALAMIAKNMTGANISPTETINYYTENNHWYPGGGSLISALPASAGAFGLNASSIANKGDIAAYKEVFDRGGLVTVSARGTSPFLPQGHTIVLRGITTDNKFLIADPGYRETNVPPANQISVDKILTDIRSDSSSASYAYYKK